MEYRRARSTREARWACEVSPLTEPNDPRYVALEHHLGLRRGDTSLLLADLDPRAPGRPDYYHHHLALAGPRGSGKSTMMLQSFGKLREMGLFPVNVDVIDALDPGDIGYSDLLLALVAAVDEALEREGITIDAAASQNVRRWFSETLLTQEHIRELRLGVETGAELGGGLPLVGRLVAKITAAFKGGSRYREEIRQRIDRIPNELVEKVNLYLEAATNAIQHLPGDFREILVFFDNLEKVNRPSQQVDEVLVRRAPLLRRIGCAMVYAIPFGLLFNPGEAGLVSDAFNVVVVPMVGLRGRNDPPDTMRTEISEEFAEIIRLRVNVEEVFADPGLLSEIVRLSGGCPRDLLHLTKLACQYAATDQITDDSLRRAIRRARVEQLRPTRASDFERLARVHRDKQIANTDDDTRLLFHRLLLHYNDLDWYDVHPLVLGDSRFQAALSALSALAG